MELFLVWPYDFRMISSYHVINQYLSLVTGTCFTTAADLFNLFFTVQLIQSIVDHTNSYAYTKLSGGTHSSYAKSDGSWEETTPHKINQLIAAMIYFGLVRVDTSIDQYWSTKTLFHGLWARGIISRIRFRSVMA